MRERGEDSIAIASDFSFYITHLFSLSFRAWEKGLYTFLVLPSRNLLLVYLQAPFGCYGLRNQHSHTLRSQPQPSCRNCYSTRIYDIVSGAAAVGPESTARTPCSGDNALLFLNVSAYRAGHT